LQNSNHNFQSEDESRNRTNFCADSPDRPGAGPSSHPVSGSPVVSGYSDIWSRVLARDSAAGPAFAWDNDIDSLSHDHLAWWDSALAPRGPRGAVQDGRLSATMGSAHGSSTPGSMATDRTTGSAVPPDLLASGLDATYSSGSLPGSSVVVSPMAAPPLQLEHPRTCL
jgi:hypothetical protein